jgi:hypothetical protein
MTGMSEQAPARRLIQGSVDIPDADIRHGYQRACDADRNRYIAHLSECFRLGYIPAETFHTRMAAAAEATTQDQLTLFLADLPPLEPVRQKRTLASYRESLGEKTPRRWLHILAGTFALCWAVLLPITIYTWTGYPVVYGTGNWAWEVTQHHAPAVAAMWFCIITGIVGLAADIFFWTSWEWED